MTEPTKLTLEKIDEIIQSMPDPEIYFTPTSKQRRKTFSKRFNLFIMRKMIRSRAFRRKVKW